MKKILFTVTALFLIVFTASAQLEKHQNLKKKLAIEGYDPVAYFTAKKATDGNKQFALSYKGAIYYFANATNKALFSKNPVKYAPQYGGWCAYAMGSSGDKVEVDPETFKILAGKLYLFYNSWGNNTLPKWNKAETSLKSKADSNWAKILKK